MGVGAAPGSKRTPNDVSRCVLDAAFRVHTRVGPGLLESVYQTCLAYELQKAGVPLRREVAVPIEYDGIKLDGGLRIDLLVDECVLVEVKSVERILPVHRAQVISYLKLTGLSLGLLLNFNVEYLKNGIMRVVHGTAWQDEN